MKVRCCCFKSHHPMCHIAASCVNMTDLRTSGPICYSHIFGWRRCVARKTPFRHLKICDLFAFSCSKLYFCFYKYFGNLFAFQQNLAVFSLFTHEQNQKYIFSSFNLKKMAYFFLFKLENYNLSGLVL